MITQQDLDAAIAEFGNTAYKRFTDDCGLLFSDNDELLREFVDWCDIEFKPLSDLLEHDVLFYGNKAYKMWEWQYNDCGQQGAWFECNGPFRPNLVYRRKEFKS